MAELGLTTPTSRRAVTLGGGVVATGGIFSSVGPLTSAARGGGRVDGHEHHDDRKHQQGALPVDQIQQIVQAEATVTKCVLSIDIERKGIGDVSGPLGVTFTPAFELDGTLTFQPLGHKVAFFNGDIALKPEETQGHDRRHRRQRAQLPSLALHRDDAECVVYSLPR